VRRKLVDGEQSEGDAEQERPAFAGDARDGVVVPSSVPWYSPKSGTEEGYIIATIITPHMNR
jgi:hypothetical protein